MEPPVRGPFGPPIRDPDEQREIDQHPGVLEEADDEGDETDRQNDVELDPEDLDGRADTRTDS